MFLFPAIGSRRIIALASASLLVGVLAAFGIFRLAAGATTHVNSPGSSFQHIESSHYNNPGHARLSFKSPNTNEITSGGRFHDGCSSTTCTGAFSGSHWSNDIGAYGDYQTGLSIDYYGQGSGASHPIDETKHIWIGAPSLGATSGSMILRVGGFAMVFTSRTQMSGVRFIKI
jgi:hypothetical protein